MELLPQIEVDFIQEEPEQLKEELDELDEEEAEKVAEDIKRNNDPEHGEYKSVIPTVEKPEKNIIPEEDIFVEKKSKKAESDKPVKKKRQVSEAQLERLRLGREKALATRRAKAQEKKEIKELQDKKKKKELTKLRAEVNDEPDPEPEPTPEPKPTRKSIMSLEDLPAEVLIQLQQKAIEGYDTKRKARKEQKRKEQNENQNNQYISGLVQNAVNPTRPPARYGEAGFFNDCF